MMPFKIPPLEIYGSQRPSFQRGMMPLKNPPFEIYGSQRPSFQRGMMPFQNFTFPDLRIMAATLGTIVPPSFLHVALPSVALRRMVAATTALMNFLALQFAPALDLCALGVHEEA
jgi:hypothetical protein